MSMDKSINAMLRAGYTCLYTLGCKQRSDAAVYHVGNYALVEYGAHTYRANWHNFFMLNFTCPLEMLW